MPALIRIPLLLSTITAVLFLPVVASPPATGQATGGQAAAGADPIWCPEGVAPIGGAGGCSPSYTTLTGLIAWLASNDPAVPGVIWLERTYDSALEAADSFVLDGRDFEDFDTQTLTIQGGWNGFGTTSINHDDPSLFNGDSLYFWYWNAGITINDVVFDGTTLSGFLMHTIGDIHLSNVHAQNSGGTPGNGHGAALWNVDAGDVVIVDSSFSGNNDVGLLVTTSGAVSLHNVTANGNGRGRVEPGGVSISNRSDGPSQNVTITGVNVFNDNYARGLMVFSDGAIELHEVTANGTFHDTSDVGTGVYLDNTTADTPQPVRVIGTTHNFNNNGSSGLVVNAHGVIHAENLTAVGNGTWGTTLVNSGTGSGELTLDGDNAFLNNGFSGLGIWSNETIRLSTMTVAGNGEDGVWIRTPTDTLVNCAKVNSNGDFGIDASGILGALTFNDVEFDGLNVSGDYSYAGTPVLDKGGCAEGGEPAPDPDAPPFDFIDLGEGGLISLDCGELSGTGAVLSNGLRLLLDCPTVGDVVLKPFKIGSIPDPLPEGFEFLAGLDLAFTDGAYDKKGTPGLITLSFPTPKNLKNSDLAILYWDGGKWIDLDGAHFDDTRMVYGGGYGTREGTFDALVNFTGSFVLARR